MAVHELHLCFRADRDEEARRRAHPDTTRATGAELLRDLVTRRVTEALRLAGEGTFLHHAEGQGAFGDGAFNLKSVFDVLDFDRAEEVVRYVVDVPELAGKVAVLRRGEVALTSQRVGQNRRSRIMTMSRVLKVQFPSRKRPKAQAKFSSKGR